MISEVKRRSPSKGDLFADLDATALARTYEAGGASCLSVLTDVDWFGGSVEDLQAARAAVSLPVIRKDFTVDPRDVVDARLMGADCVLLIAAALDDAQLSDFHALAKQVGLDALIEIHDERELERALVVGGDLVGVNQRDLVTFEVDQDVANMSETIKNMIEGRCPEPDLRPPSLHPNTFLFRPTVLEGETDRRELRGFHNRILMSLFLFFSLVQTPERTSPSLCPT